MGTDIYIFQEKREGDMWVYDGEFPFKGRDYDLFGWLDGNFSSKFTAIAKDRGLPYDITPETKKHIEDIEGDEGCGESWLTFKEIMDNVESDAEKQRYFEEFIGTIEYISENDDLANHRIVFCFII